MPYRLCSALASALLLAIATPLGAAPSWDVETLLGLDTAEQFRVSPDGARAVWVKRGLSPDGDSFSWHLQLSDLTVDENGHPAEPRTLTFHESDSESPRWSPDGASIAFLSDRNPDAGTQIWLLPMAGGEARAVTAHPGGVHDFAWLPEGRILYLAGEGKTRREIDLEEAGDEAEVVGDEEHVPPRRLFLLNLDDESVRRMGDDPAPVTGFSASPDGRHTVAVHELSIHDDYDSRTPPAVRLWNLDTGEAADAIPAEMRAYDFVWDLASEGFYFRRPVASDPADLFVSIDNLGYYELASGAWRPVPLEWERGLGWWGPFATEKGVLVELADGVRNRLLHLERKGEGWKRRALPPAPRGIEVPLALGPDGKTLLLARSHASSPQRYVVGELKKGAIKDEREFLRLNPQLADLPMPKTEPFWWVGAEGDTIEGMLHYPLDFDAQTDERHPLIVMIHGGPTDVDLDYFLESWGGSPGLFASRGAFVLRPNYHGSAGYGLAWAESIKGRYYELEVPDILAGVDALLELGHVDAARLGLQGWSNGAILGVAVCIASGERFRVLDAGAGDVNWSSDFGNCAFGAGFEYAYFGGAPWELPEIYVEKSPLFRIDELRVPTLISFGAEDTAVPTEQGWEFYRAMQQAGQAPVRFVLYPGEGHSLMSPISRRRQMNEQLAWFDRWLFDTPAKGDGALLAGSPLDRALRLSDAARMNGHFGELVDDSLLVPELIPLDGLLVGRFEVTRAQWAAHLGNPDFAAPDEGDLPVTDLGIEQARAYCAWLGELLGLNCRLPSEEEWEQLAALAAAAAVEGENTLARWAGYAPGREDALRLAERIELLEAERSLLLPVGSLAPAGESGFYDLGGNAAEWVEDGEGGANLRGLCAVTAEDPYGVTPEAPAAYGGLRVVAEPSTAGGGE